MEVSGWHDTPERRARQQSWRGLDESSVMSAELITSTLLWFGVGWLLDRLLGTMPWFMFAGALLGNWAGLYLLWLRGQRSEANTDTQGATTAPRPSPSTTAAPRVTETPGAASTDGRFHGPDEKNSDKQMSNDDD